MKSHLVFFIVDNLNKGLELEITQSQKIQIANLNLQGMESCLVLFNILLTGLFINLLILITSAAGNKAISSSAFHSAVNYLRTGISLLNGDSWITDYDLSIQLYDTALEACFASGQFFTFEEMVKQPLTYARCFEDKLNIYHNLVRYLTAAGRSEEALTTSLSVLDALGEKIPIDSDLSTFLEEAMHLKELLQSSKQDLLELPVMNDFSKVVSST